MSDLISRQDAIRWVKTECNLYGKPTLDFESGKRVIEHLKQMPPAQPEDKCSECDAWNKYKNYRYPQWIPVSERLPEEGKQVLVCDAYGFIYTAECEVISDDEWLDWQWYESVEYLPRDDVVAWMPLPEPYREVE